MGVVVVAGLAISYLSIESLLPVDGWNLVGRMLAGAVVLVALITAGRFSGGSHGFVVGHVAPEAGVGGPLALLRNGDTLTIDAEKRTLSVALSAAELKRRRLAGRAKPPYAVRGVLAKYVREVTSASTGAVTDPAPEVLAPPPRARKVAHRRSAARR